MPRQSIRVSATCPQCQNQFDQRPSDFARGRRFCSLNCAIDATRVSVHTPNCTCDQCGILFYANPARIQARGARFCSMACRRAYGPTHTEPNGTCELCGTAFRTSPAKARARRFCSYACHNKARRLETKTGRDSCYGRDWRAAVLARDKGQCQECGTVDGRIHAHHIKPWSRFPELRFDVANGVTLCEACHFANHRWMPRNTHDADSASVVP